MGGVRKHNGAEATGGVCRIYFSAEAVLHKKRQLSGMVYMRVSEKEKVNFGGRDGEMAVFIYIGTLLHTAVDKKFCFSRFDKRARACYLVCRADKRNLHKITFLFRIMITQCFFIYNMQKKKIVY